MGEDHPPLRERGTGVTQLAWQGERRVLRVIGRGPAEPGDRHRGLWCRPVQLQRRPRHSWRRLGDRSLCGHSAPVSRLTEAGRPPSLRCRATAVLGMGEQLDKGLPDHSTLAPPKCLTVASFDHDELSGHLRQTPTRAVFGSIAPGERPCFGDRRPWTLRLVRLVKTVPTCGWRGVRRGVHGGLGGVRRRRSGCGGRGSCGSGSGSRAGWGG